MKAGALFCGIGGFCYGFEGSGIETVWANDNDRYACETYRTNFPRVRLIEKDVRELSVSGDSLEPVDVLHAGFPCQSFSQAGARKGFADDRGKLFFEILRLVSEFGEQRPKVLVLENSPFIKSGDGGAWFLEIIQAIQRAGYWFRESSAIELDLSMCTDIPQQRSRLFLVAFSRRHFRSGRFELPATEERKIRPDGLSRFVEFEGMQDDRYYLNPENRYYKMIADHANGSDRPQCLFQLRKYFVRTKDSGVCPTLTANMGQGGHNIPFLWDRKGLRKLTELECLRLQGFPPPPKFRFPIEVSSVQRYSQIGNSVAPPLAKLLAGAIAKKISKECR